MRRMSQAELAKKAGLQPTAISHFETATRSPSFDNLKRLADALNVATDYLIGRSDELKLAGPEADNLFPRIRKTFGRGSRRYSSHERSIAREKEGD